MHLKGRCRKQEVGNTDGKVVRKSGFDVCFVAAGGGACGDRGRRPPMGDAVANVIEFD
jgi:hypothetical protein